MTAALRKRSNGLAPKSRERIWELDFLRGVCVLLMIFDHFMFDIAGLFDKAWIATGKENIIQIVELAQNYINNSTLRTTTQHIVVWIFALLCGISCSFSRSNLKRGVQATILAGIITIVSYCMDVTIKFGILHMFAFTSMPFSLRYKTTSPRLALACPFPRITASSRPGTNIGYIL